MGFGTIIASMVSIAAILFASYAAVRGGLYMAGTISDSVRDMQENENDMLKTEIEISSITANGTEINIKINNTGHKKIREFTEMDVIVHYENAFDEVKTVWMPYKKDTPLENEWKVNGIVPDYVNPGVFDPNEVMTIKVGLSAEERLKYGSGNWVQITTPNGVGTSRYFTG